MSPALRWLALVCVSGCMTGVQNSGETGAAQPLARREPVAALSVSSSQRTSPVVTRATTESAAESAQSVATTPGANCVPPENQPDMRLVPGGTFIMGADVGGEEDEHPAHPVTVEDFWLEVNEVTVEQYQQCVTAGVCRQSRDQFDLRGANFAESRFRRPNQPISGVSWDDARLYCSFRGRRLPREAEWERAARGDDARRYPWGNDAPNPTIHGCFARALGTSNGTTCAVGSYPAGAGPYGHLDMAGNVWEWMADHYDPFAYRRPGAARGEPGGCPEILETQDWLRANQRQGFTGTNPIPTSCERVLRGGAFNYPPTGLRSSNRVHHPGEWRLLMAGVRCAKDRAVSQPESSTRVPCAQEP